MKPHHLLLLLLGTIPSHAAFQKNQTEAQPDFADYHFIDVPVEDTPPPPLMVDFDKMAQDFILETKRIEIPGHPCAFNPSIIRWKGSLLMSFRSYDPKTHSTNPMGLIWLDENFNPIGTPQIFELPFKNPVLVSKQQDPRLITVGERLFLVYNNIKEDVTHREMRRMFIVELFHEAETFRASEPECLMHFEGENEMRYEKNWVPFEFNGELHLGYSIIPHRILRPLLGTNTCETAYETKKPFKWDWGVPRGGTQAFADGDHYIAFFHSWTDVPTVQSGGKKISHYVMGAYTFDSKPPFSLIAVSPEPIVAHDFYRPPYYKTWKPLRCVFPAGIVLDEDFVWVSYGRQDNEVWIIKIDKKGLLNSLVPVSSEQI
ncbi:MAG: hypothetical protein JSS60_05575 [Verrucomicrobia bacterium]|nr:hypothetical protein [Verrucomicrobiota bacterium]